MQLITDLKTTAANLSPSSRFTIFNGLLYMGAGALLMLWPAVVQVVFRDPTFQGNEAVLMRILGMTVMIIGWFYFFGGRTGGRQIVAASVLDRIILVPLVLVPAAVAGVFPHLLVTFAVLDPALGLMAWYLLAREKSGSTEPKPHTHH